MDIHRAPCLRTARSSSAPPSLAFSPCGIPVTPFDKHPGLLGVGPNSSRRSNMGSWVGIWWNQLGLLPPWLVLLWVVVIGLTSWAVHLGVQWQMAKEADWAASFPGPSGIHIQMSYDTKQPRFVMLLCDRGQLSNRLMCLSRGLKMARVLNRTLVMPVITDDNRGLVNTSMYLDLTCFRCYGQAETFEYFQRSICQAVGMQPSPHLAAGELCETGEALDVPEMYSLSDQQGKLSCANRNAGTHSAHLLGVRVHGCVNVEPDDGCGKEPCVYKLQPFKDRFLHKTDQVLVFADMFGVSLFDTEEDMAKTVTSPAQLCSFMPAPNFMAAARWLRARFMQRAKEQRCDDEAPVDDSFLAAHIRRGDWWWYCTGARNCFFSMPEVGKCLNEDMTRTKSSVVYVATNADTREREMLIRALNGRAVFWDDVLEMLKNASAPKLDLGDRQVVSMLEKALCTAADSFILSTRSTFSVQILMFRQQGLGGLEMSTLENYFNVTTDYHANTQDTCAGKTPLVDERPLLDTFNFNLFLHQLTTGWKDLWKWPSPPNMAPADLLKLAQQPNQSKRHLLSTGGRDPEPVMSVPDHSACNSSDQALSISDHSAHDSPNQVLLPVSDHSAHDSSNQVLLPASDYSANATFNQSVLPVSDHSAHAQLHVLNPESNSGIFSTKARHMANGHSSTTGRSSHVHQATACASTPQAQGNLTLKQHNGSSITIHPSTTSQQTTTDANTLSNQPGKADKDQKDVKQSTNSYVIQNVTPVADTLEQKGHAFLKHNSAASSQNGTKSRSGSINIVGESRAQQADANTNRLKAFNPAPAAASAPQTSLQKVTPSVELSDFHARQVLEDESEELPSTCLAAAEQVHGECRGFVSRWWSRLQLLFLAVWDLHAWGAANRFMSMYTSPRFMALHVEAGDGGVDMNGVLNLVKQRMQGEQLLALYVSWGQVREDVKHEVHIMLSHESMEHGWGFVELGEQDQELSMAWAKANEGEGHSRHEEPGVVMGLPGLLPMLNFYMCIKSTVFVATHKSEAAWQVWHARKLFGYGSPIDQLGCRQCTRFKPQQCRRWL